MGHMSDGDASKRSSREEGRQSRKETGEPPGDREEEEALSL